MPTQSPAPPPASNTCRTPCPRMPGGALPLLRLRGDCAAPLRSSTTAGAQTQAGEARSPHQGTALTHDLIEKVSTRAILGFNDPGIGIEADFALQAFLDPLVGYRFETENTRECALSRVCFVEGRL